MIPTISDMFATFSDYISDVGNVGKKVVVKSGGESYWSRFTQVNILPGYSSIRHQRSYIAENSKDIRLIIEQQSSVSH